MACGGGETTYTAGVPEDTKALRAKLLAYLGNNMAAGGTSPAYGGTLTPGVNSLQGGAANILSQLMGQGNFRQSPIIGGQATNNVNWPSSGGQVGPHPRVVSGQGSVTPQTPQLRPVTGQATRPFAGNPGIGQANQSSQISSILPILMMMLKQQ